MSKLKLGSLVLAAGVALAGVLAFAGQETGRIGPSNGIQPSGRKLNPVGKTTWLGNLTAGSALTPDGRFLWTVSAGRGPNDIRIVRVKARKCRQGLTDKECKAWRRRTVGRIVQRIPLPGASGGVVLDGDTAYVSGTPETTDEQNQTGEDVPGKGGDVIHVFKYTRKTGRAERSDVIEVPPPDSAPPVQTFPPDDTRQQSWPRDLALSPDGKTLLAALNLADHAAIIDTKTKEVRYTRTGRYPYGAAILRDGKTGLVSNEADGTVSVIDLESGQKVKDIVVGPHLSHPEGIAVDPKAARAYVAVTHQDLIAVIDTATFEVERSLSVGRPEGLGTGPVHVSVTEDGCRLLSANSGEDAVAVFSLPNEGCASEGSSALRARAERILRHEARQGAERAESTLAESAEVFGPKAEERVERKVAEQPLAAVEAGFELLGRVPVASYPVAAFATPDGRKLVWVTAKGLGVGTNQRDADDPPIVPDPGSAAGNAPGRYQFHYLPELVRGMSGIVRFPSPGRLAKLTPRASRQIRPSNSQTAPADTPLRPDGPIEHVFYIVRENRTYDQILGDDPRGDGDPKLTLFGEDVTPNAHALARRFPLLDHVYANSEASIDGHFWTSAAAVSDYVVKNWHQNYAGRDRPYDFGVYAVSWPSQGFLFDQAEEQGISWFNYGEAIAGTVPLNDIDRTPEENAQVAAKFAKSDLGPTQPGPQPDPPAPCFSNDASSGGTNVISRQEVFDSSRPEGANPLNTESRFECFKERFQQQLASPQGVPAFNYITLPNDHTNGTTPGSRTPRAMIAENDLALGEVVDLISHSPIWEKSLILVIEDDSQDGLDHVDAHRIPAFAISPYAKRNAVVHTRYDFLSFIRTLELVIGMEPLNLFDSLAVPLYDAFDGDPSDNDEPYNAIQPEIDLLERNTEDAVNARLSERLPLEFTDRTPQRILDKILWQYVHGADSVVPPPGPNASGIDMQRWRRHRPNEEDLLAELLEELFGIGDPDEEDGR